MGAVKLHETRWDRVGLNGLIDRGDDHDVILGNLNDDPASGEAGYYFIFTLLGLRGSHGRDDQRGNKKTEWKTT
jgi:hypothetical protein